MNIFCYGGGIALVILLKMKYLYQIMLLVMSLLMALSCKGGWKYAVYKLPAKGGTSLCITNWDVYGPVSQESDSLLFDPVEVCRNGKMTLRAREAMSFHHEGYYRCLYNQLDLREVYGIDPADTSHVLNGTVTYLCSHIVSDEERNVFVEVNKTMECCLFLNGDTLRRIDIQGPDIYPAHIKRGDNVFLVQARVTGDDCLFEARIHDRAKMVGVYAGCQSGNIVYPMIDPKSGVAVITNAHQRVVPDVVSLAFDDIYGRQVAAVKLEKDKFEYQLPHLEEGRSYMCVMHVGGLEVRQPVLYGNPDSLLVAYEVRRRSINDTHPAAVQIDGLLYRLRLLLDHPSRYDGDWWWQFKIPTVTYQLECAFSQVEKPVKSTCVENNIQLVSYRSDIDGSVQHYMLAKPNHVDAKQSIPLVVIVRPFIENPHPFMSCPQLARQWAINQVQWFANKYNCLIVMPEMHSDMDDDITPKAEKELAAVIKVLKDHYPVDAERVYLHGNCSGGYRALRIATDMPDVFSAIALYAPAYHCPYGDEMTRGRAPEKSLARLKNMSVFVHGDPIDMHSPWSQYKDFVKDCRDSGIDLTLSMKRNSGRFYNVVLVGEEAFDFLMGENADER